jgi:hypothetical protein
MSWSYQKVGRASKLAEVVKQQIVAVQGCPKGSAEEAAKNQLGDVAETLCKSLLGDKVVTINGTGSAWNNVDGSAGSQYVKFEFSTNGDFVE